MIYIMIKLLFNAWSKKSFFFFLLIMSTLISITSSSWLGCWMGLEINLLSFIVLMSMPLNFINSKLTLKYFFIQSIASLNFLFSIITLFTFLKMLEFIPIFMNLTMLMKLGSAPMHFWFIKISKKLSWNNNFFLMTWQKISPMIFISYMMNFNLMIYTTILNMLISMKGSFNQTSLRKLMAFSSINNLGWLISTLLISENLWTLYFSFYFFFTLLICSIFQTNKLFYLNQLFNLNNNFMFKLMIFLNFVSLSGLPPFSGFFPKWMTLNNLILNNQLLLSFIFVMSSLIMSFVYFKMIYSSFMMISLKFKWIKSSSNMKMNYIMNIINVFMTLGIMLCSYMFFLY
uniref:NADH-ubiquinone oxidoreductase chain 2 n=1 Tax=Bematistes alcinoe TaxID=502015 RepID=A0A140CVG6_9NEOP|nr:NADH dehydrogenase subunit 2 [Bematistes alcinoe]AMJ17290.1 NADH dehydrogenase subunit 2 [Bematistes alcinoe]